MGSYSHVNATLRAPSLSVQGRICLGCWHGVLGLQIWLGLFRLEMSDVAGPWNFKSGMLSCVKKWRHLAFSG